jgi:hypothetical protein
MEVSYVMSLADYRAFNRYVLKHTKGGLFLRILKAIFLGLVILAWLLLIATFPYTTGNWADYPIFLPIWTVGLTILWLFRYRISEWASIGMLSAADKAKMSCVHNISITPEGVRYSSEQISANLGWSGIQQIVATTDYVFFFLSSHAGHVVPRRAFASSDDFHEFAETAQEFKERAEEESPRDALGSAPIATKEWHAKIAKRFHPSEEHGQIRAEDAVEKPPPSVEPK